MHWVLLFLLLVFLFGAAFFSAAKTGLPLLWLVTALLAFLAAASYIKLGYRLKK